MENKKIFIVMPAYNAEKTIAKVFERIPREFLSKIKKFVIINDGSTDNTKSVINSLKQDYPNIELINKEKNQGYARGQKSGYKKVLEMGGDIAVLLHSDGQYAPEEMPRLVEPLIKGEADIVQGSRMLSGDALDGGMPKYKYFANIILSKMENICYGMKLAEYHSGYVLYSKKALQTIPFEKLSNTFHFDGEMLFMGNDYNLKIQELPIPTCYAEEVSHLKPVQYGLNVLKIMIRYKLGKYKFDK